MQISFPQRYLDFDYISVKTAFRQSQASSHHAKESSRASQGLCTAHRGGSAPSTAPGRGTLQGKASTACRATSATHTSQPVLSSVGWERSCGNPSQPLETPSAITGECEAIPKYATKFSSQGPVLERRKRVQLLYLVLDVPLSHFCRPGGLGAASLLLLNHSFAFPKHICQLSGVGLCLHSSSTSSSRTPFLLALPEKLHASAPRDMMLERHCFPAILPPDLTLRCPSLTGN